MMATAALHIVLTGWLWPFSKKPEDDKNTVGSLENTEIVIEPNQTVGASADRAINSYRAFLDLVPDDPILRAEAMRRLADLQLQASEDAQIDHDMLMLEDAAYLEAVRLYEMLLEANPDYQQLGSVLYQLARAYENSNQVEKALATLNRLVTEYPDSKYYDEAQFRRGEILFVARRYYDSELAYGPVIARGSGSQYFEQSLYKHGWALFKQSEHERSLDSFFGLLDMKLVAANDTDIRIVMESMSRPEREMVEDTFRVLSISFSYMDGAETISSYFSESGFPPYAFLIYTNLGDLYIDKERYSDAADTYKAFVELNPYHEHAPLLQVEVIEAYKKAGFPTLVLEGKEEFVESYGLSSDFWAHHRPDERPAVIENLKSNLKDLAHHHHALAQASGEANDFDAAARWYRELIVSFPGDPEAPASNFLLAEILFDNSRYMDATAEYIRTAYDYGEHEKAAESGYASILAYQKHEELLDGSQKVTWHRDGIENSLRFARSFPGHEQTPAVMTLVAEDLFGLGEFDLAIQVANMVVELQPPASPDMQRTAWTVIGHARFDQQNYFDAEIAYLNVRSLMSSDYPDRQAISERLASSIYKQAEQARDAGQLEQAVGHFQRVGAVVPESSIVTTADYDAAVALVQLENWDGAISALERFRGDNPDHEYVAEIGRNLAIAYGKAERPLMAAGEFERIADNDSESADVRREAIWQAAELYENGGDVAGATRAYSSFIDRYPYPLNESMDARQKLADMNKASGDMKTYNRWLHKIIDADARSGELRTDRSKYLAAQASLVLARPAIDSYNAAKLVIPLKDSLKVKRKRMEAALDALGKVADYSVAETTTEATYLIAQIYHTLSRDLFDSERPAELSDLEIEQYEILLEEQAYPFEEQAIDIYQANAARASDGVYDEWVRKSFDQLAELMPARYAKIEVGEDLVTALR